MAKLPVFLIFQCESHSKINLSPRVILQNYSIFYRIMYFCRFVSLSQNGYHYNYQKERRMKK